MGEILLYSSLSPILDTPLIFKKRVKFKPNTDNLRGIYCYIVFYQQRRIFCYNSSLPGDNILWGIKRSTTVLLYFTRNFSHRVSLLTSLMKQYILLRYIIRYPTSEIQYSKILSGGGSILLVKTKEYTMLYITDKSQGVWMTKFFRMSVFYRALKGA